MQSALDESKISLLCGKGGQFELACLFWPVICTCDAVSVKQVMVYIAIFYQGAIQKVRTPKSNTS